MTSRSFSHNAFETQLSSGITAGSSSLPVSSKAGLQAPGYLVVDPDSPTKREYIKFNSLGVSSLDTTDRGLTGSAAGAQDHDVGTPIRAVAVHQWIDDLWNDFESHFGGTAVADHPEGTQSVRGFIAAADKAKLDNIEVNAEQNQTKAELEALGMWSDANDGPGSGLNADLLDGEQAAAFADVSHAHGTAPPHNHDTDYADIVHEGSNNGHPDVTGASDGFMTKEDKVILDGLVSSGGEANQTVQGGDHINGGPTTGDITLDHAAGYGAPNRNYNGASVPDVINVDSFGHVSSHTTRNLTPADIGALPNSSPNVIAGGYKMGGVMILNSFTGYTHLYQGAGHIIYGDGVDECYVGGVPFQAGTFNVECNEDGAERQLFYDTIASAREFKNNIAPVELDGSEVLKWEPHEYSYKADPNDTMRTWFIAEDILDASGERYVRRDNDGKLINTDDRTMIVTLIKLVQEQDARIAALEAAT